jgi:lysophospholipase L1-like esterase
MRFSASLRFGLLFVLAAGLIGIGWILNRHKLWERWVTFQRLPVFGKSWANEVDKMAHLYPEDTVDYLFLGDSHMEQCEWQEFFPGKRVANRGIGGETTEGLLTRLNALPKARLIFLQIGINDLLMGQTPQKTAQRYSQIIKSLEVSGTQKVVPVQVFYTRYSPDVNPAVSELNAFLLEAWQKEGREYLTLNEDLSPKRELLQNYTLDGIHLNAQGYRIWIQKIKDHLKTAEVGSP